MLRSLRLPSDTNLMDIHQNILKLWDAIKEIKDRLDKF